MKIYTLLDDRGEVIAEIKSREFEREDKSVTSYLEIDSVRMADETKHEITDELTHYENAFLLKLAEENLQVQREIHCDDLKNNH